MKINYEKNSNALGRSLIKMHLTFELHFNFRLVRIQRGLTFKYRIKIQRFSKYFSHKNCTKKKTKIFVNTFKFKTYFHLVKRVFLKQFFFHKNYSQCILKFPAQWYFFLKFRRTV